MEVHENTAPKTARQQPLIKRMFLRCIRFLGLFLFILFMTHSLLVSMKVDIQWHESMSYIVILSCFVCVTIGANYWFGDHVIQWRSYCIASIITFFFYFAFLVFLIGETNYKVNLLQFIAITLLPIISAVYSIWKIRQAKKRNQAGFESNPKRQTSKRSIALANTARLVALISFCSVFHEYAQNVLTFILAPEFRTIRMYAFSVVLDAIVAAYALWLLICFARKEFVQLGKQKENDKDCVEKASGGN
jgi:hypothetical protein